MDPATMLQHSKLADWQPPNDYQLVSSQVTGITVYAPRPPEKPQDKTKNFTCPHCGASTQYDVAAGGIACEYCGFQLSIHTERVGNAAVQNEFTLDVLNQYEKGWGVERQHITCDQCGAEFSTDNTSITATCPFCDSNKVNIHSTQSDYLRPRYLVPFKIMPDDNHNRIINWLGKGWYFPKNLNASAIVDRFNGIYLPFWTFGAAVSAKWDAEVGHERQERYYDNNDKTWKTHTVIDWRHENGDIQRMVNNLLITGSTHISEVILEKIKPFNLDDLVSYIPDLLAGWQAQNYDIPLADSWEKGKLVIREQAKSACYSDIASSHVRNFSMTADLANETWRLILLPIFMTSYQYQNKTYQVMVNGQTGTIAGQKPVEWWKIWTAIGLMFSPGLFIGLISIPLFAVGGIGLFSCFISVILLVISSILSIRLYQQAVESEAV